MYDNNNTKGMYLSMAQFINDNKQTEVRDLSDIAANIEAAWPKVNYTARPYLDAMYSLKSIHDNYYQDSASSIVRYFLANASAFKGEAAKSLKAELKQLIKG